MVIHSVKVSVTLHMVVAVLYKSSVWKFVIVV